MEKAAGIDPARIHFIDESGSHIAMTREYCRAPRGERVAEYLPRNRGTVTTMVAALTLNGLSAVWTYAGGTSAARFAEYIRDHLGPTLKRGDLVVWDGLGAHKSDIVKAQMAALGVSVWFLPPYSPDMNPIEYAWAPVKRALRTAKVREAADLPSAILQACRGIQSELATAFIRHCGFTAQS